MSDSYFVIILNRKSKEVGSVMGPMSEHRADRVEMGALMRCDTSAGWGVWTGTESQAKERVHDRLEQLRTALQDERISYGELAELKMLAPFIDAGDVELLEAAGVPEFEEGA